MAPAPLRKSEAAATTRIHFHLGTRRVSAQGTSSRSHGNVLHLEVQPAVLDRLVCLLFLLLALVLGNTVKSRYPEWFLPRRIVLKRQKSGWEDHFDNEKAIYRALTSIQGRVVPVCYGEARCAETDETGPLALVLSDVGGVTLKDRAASGVAGGDLERMLGDAFRALSGCRVAHDDRNLGNYRLVDNRTRIAILDFEHSYELRDDEDPDLMTASSVRFVAKYYGMRHGDATTTNKEGGCEKGQGSGAGKSEGGCPASWGYLGGMGRHRILDLVTRSGQGFFLFRG